MSEVVGYPLVCAALDSPLMGVRKRWPNVVHALTMESVIEGWERQVYVSACGLSGLRMWGMDRGGVVVGVPWPPRVKGMPERLERCRACWLATGKPRPRVEWRVRGVGE